ncbi:conserved membrane hypothetical protein [Magnetospirillum sp. LM-5]|uniref:NnrS family protein n=1 Tax=Magnetospirillum sp. LM-5 TaxID=2681466 RepID=UPI00137CD2D3|nr:NnrS family protein [Magnetospirillum sp. LM-5]CAA7620558.1 conserved membrane hypothetical protein [Magnetospirillum sp. LM-5]
MATIPLQEPRLRPTGGSVFFAAGFRPFFLSAGLVPLLMLPVWLVVYAGGLDLGIAYAPSLWHGHEMLYGFAGAAIGGFLLTAVPNWTNSHHVEGRPLMVLFALWLAGRVGFALAGLLPSALVAVIDLAYLPLLGLLVGRPLVAAGKWRNISFLFILAALWLSDLAIHADIVLGLGDGLAALWLGIGLVLVMIVVVGGRIVPSFTMNWLRMNGQPVEIQPIGWIEKGGAALSVLVGIVLAALAPTSPAAGMALLAAASINGLRLSRWYGHKTLTNPILWVLHLGYLWLVIGLALLGLSSFVPALPPSAAVHALTAGAVGTMVLGVMSRAALGHAGRMLEVSPWTVAAYVLLSLGTLARVAAPLAGGAQMGLTHAGGTLWTLAWGLFVVVYFPIVTRPRADGRPG